MNLPRMAIAMDSIFCRVACIACVTAIYGVHFNDIKMVELLLDLGASMEMRTKQDMSALLTAITRNKPKIVNLLLKRGACINLDSKNGSIKTLVEESDE